MTMQTDKWLQPYEQRPAVDSRTPEQLQAAQFLQATQNYADAHDAIEQACSLNLTPGFDGAGCKLALDAVGTAIKLAGKASSANTATAIRSAAAQAAPMVAGLRQALLFAEAIPVSPVEMPQAVSLKQDYVAALTGLKCKQRMAQVESWLGSAIASRDRLSLGVLTSVMGPSYAALKVNYPDVLESYARQVVAGEEQQLAKVGSLPGAEPLSSLLHNRRAIKSVVLSGAAANYSKLVKRMVRTIG